MDYHEALFEKAIELSTPRQKKERSIKQKINDANTSKRMKEYHAKRRLEQTNEYSLVIEPIININPASNVKNLINNIESKIALIK